MDNAFDLIVIGAGSGGLASAKRAAQHGAKVAIVEGHRVGGTCVLYGCVPKKMGVYASHFGELIKDSEGYGWDLSGSFSWERFKANRDAAVERLSGIHTHFLEKNNVSLISGMARFLNDKEIDVEGTTYRADRFLIATGGKSLVPEIPGCELAIDSKGMFLLEEQPKRLVVIGGGYIASEFATMMHGLGSSVCICVRGDGILRGFDEEVRDHIQKELTAQGIDIHANQGISGISSTDDGLVVETNDGFSVTGDVVLMATGRIPNIEGLGLDAAGVEIRNGAVGVNDGFQTSVGHIYALGDCTDKVQLTPVAIAEGRMLAEHLYNDGVVNFSYEMIPTAVFTSPELGTVGLSEQDAIREFGPDNVQVFRFNFKPLFHLLSENETRALVKVVVQKSSDKVLGMHMVGDHAAEIIQGLAVAMQMGVTKSQLTETMALHPTSAEEFVTLG